MSLKNRILVTNDDGIYSAGIYSLFEAMKEIGETYVVAPDSQKSAISHAITLSSPLRANKVNRNGAFFGWSVNGTPVDCVKLGMQSILGFQPDLIVSGINQGSNTGTNVLYSGTVAGATEGALVGIPSIAFSLTSFEFKDFSLAAEFAAVLGQKVLEEGLPEGTLLTVNIPPVSKTEIKGIKITRQGKGRYKEIFEKRIDPTNREYYWLGGEKLVLDSEDDIDEIAVANKYISVTPIHFDLTDKKILPALEKWDLSLG